MSGAGRYTNARDGDFGRESDTHAVHLPELDDTGIEAHVGRFARQSREASAGMIYLLRHGETVWNRCGRFQGRLDSPLTLAGIAQTTAMGRRLKAEIDDPHAYTIVASPLGRAWQCAAIVAEGLGIDPLAIVFEPRLAEMDYGAWEGLSHDDVEAAEPGILARRDADLWRYRTPGGESYADLAARVRPWLGSIPEPTRIIAVCHGATSRVVRGLYAGLAEDETLALSRDQGEIYRLSEGRIETLVSDVRGRLAADMADIGSLETQTPS